MKPGRSQRPGRVTGDRIRRRQRRWATAVAMVATLAAPLAARAQPNQAMASSSGSPESSGPPGAAPKSRSIKLSPAELKQLQETERDFQRYKQAADDQYERVGEILYREYLHRKQLLDSRFAKSIAAADKVQNEDHLEAMALLQKFLKKYPDEPKFTPGAMFRLANLYLDQANNEFNKRFDEEMKAGSSQTASTGKGSASGTKNGANGANSDLYSGPDYSKSIALWRQIIERFPNYRQRAGTLYLLGYYLKQVGKDRASLAVYRGLVCANKFDPLAKPPPAPSRQEVREQLSSVAKKNFVDPYANCVPLKTSKKLIQESWVRGVGDIHFNTPGELNQAIAAYIKVAHNKKSKYYSEALYKLAWSYYRNDDFMKGIEAFDRSVAYSDQLVAEGKPPLDLRQEAIQYIAVSFTDPWSVDEQPDPQRSFDRAWAYYKNRLNEPHVRDVWEKLGDTFRILEANQQAVASYRIAINNWPLNPRDPIVHEKLVDALAALGDKDAADAEAAVLVKRYARGSKWYQANETNRVAMENQARIGEHMLIAAAENTHRDAQLARKAYLAKPTPQGEKKYIALYQKAASLYQQFINEYPTADEVYEFTYRLGETEFFSKQYAKAIVHYRWVRDHRRLSQKRFELAAQSIVQSYQKLIDQQVAAGRLPNPPVPKTKDLKALPKPIQPEAIPTLYRQQQAALDKYQQLINDPQTAPKMALIAALISYRFHHLDDAIKRFGHVMTKFCGSDQAAKAKDGLLAIYDARGQTDKFKATNNQFIASKCGNAKAIKLAKEQNRSLDFEAAQNLFQAKRYGDAALAFYRYYKTTPKTDDNRPVSLYNSAVAYDRSGKPKTALYLFQEFTRNKDPKFRKSQYYLPALYLTAVAAQKAFDYNQAVDTYLKVVKLAGQKGRKQPPGGQTLQQMRLDALYNAAVLRELDRVYRDPRGRRGTGAVSLYRRYARVEPDPTKQDKALWAVARVYKSAQDPRDMVKAYATWRRKFGNAARNQDKYVYSYYDIAKTYAKKGDSRAADRYRRETMKAWQQVGSPKGGQAADMAAECAFYFAEQTYHRKFDPFKIRRVPTNARAAKHLLDHLDALTNKVKKNYTDIGKYNSSFWGLAALVRVGDTLFYSGEKVAEAPVPRKIERLDRKYPDKDILLKYQDSLTKSLVAPKQKAAKQQWIKVVKAGKAAGVSNKWTRLAKQRLHDFVSQDDYPVQRAPLVEGTKEP